MTRTLPLLAAIAVSLGLAGPAAAERGAHRAAMLDRLFERVDTNTDGAIDAGEFRAARQLRFERRDADGDGYVDKTEFTARRARPAGAPELTEEQQRKRAAWRERIFGKLDQDDDARISEPEAEAAGQHMFVQLDADGDGRIVREEMRRPERGTGAE